MKLVNEPNNHRICLQDFLQGLDFEPWSCNCIPIRTALYPRFEIRVLVNNPGTNSLETIRSGFLSRKMFWNPSFTYWLVEEVSPNAPASLALAPAADLGILGKPPAAVAPALFFSVRL